MADKDITVVSEFPDSGSESIDTGSDGCIQDIEQTTKWEYAAAISVEGDRDEIYVGDSGYVDIHIHDMFPKRPSNLLGGCSFSTGGIPLEPSPDSVTYTISAGDERINLAEPVPWPNDGDPDNNYADLAALALAVGSASAPPWGALTATGIGVLLTGDRPDPIEFSRPQGSKETYMWEYLLDGTSGLDGLPNTREETGGVKASIQNESLGSGEYTDISVDTAFTFRIPSLGGYCPCEDFVLVNETAETSFLELVEGE
ncbi:hypothetical protein [Haloferax elongans]|uniref:hypothetical protein n=1 Tax=Haloferax elongans TaxID=403191 RepID=UPI001F4D0CC3|nr:hypothetical protein [Haloferax elongans]